MVVSGLTLRIFVVWTNKGIFTVEVPYDPTFMSVQSWRSSCSKGFFFFFFLWGGGGGGLPDQIHHGKHFALPKIPAFQSNTQAALHSSPVATQKQMPLSVLKVTALSKQLTTGTSQSPLYIDLSQCSAPTPPSESVEISGLQIYQDDVETVQPKPMITDTIVLFLFK